MSGNAFNSRGDAFRTRGGAGETVIVEVPVEVPGPTVEVAPPGVLQLVNKAFPDSGWVNSGVPGLPLELLKNVRLITTPGFPGLQPTVPVPCPQGVLLIPASPTLSVMLQPAAALTDPASALALPATGAAVPRAGQYAYVEALSLLNLGQNGSSGSSYRVLDIAAANPSWSTLAEDVGRFYTAVAAIPNVTNPHLYAFGGNASTSLASAPTTNLSSVRRLNPLTNTYTNLPPLASRPAVVMSPPAVVGAPSGQFCIVHRSMSGNLGGTAVLDANRWFEIYDETSGSGGLEELTDWGPSVIAALWSARLARFIVLTQPSVTFGRTRVLLIDPAAPVGSRCTLASWTVPAHGGTVPGVSGPVGGDFDLQTLSGAVGGVQLLSTHGLGVPYGSPRPIWQKKS